MGGSAGASPAGPRHSGGLRRTWVEYIGGGSGPGRSAGPGRPRPTTRPTSRAACDDVARTHPPPARSATVIDFSLTDENRLVRESVRQFIAVEILPNIRAWDERGEAHPEVFAKMGELGYLGAPRYPSSPIFAKTSGCASPRSSHARMFGRISTAMNWRTDSRTSRFSSVRLKSITVALRAGGGQVRATSSHAARDVGRVVGRGRSGPADRPGPTGRPGPDAPQIY